MDSPFALDGYAVADLIGFGATGEVWRGRDESSGEPVALKRLWEPLSPDRIERMRKEASLLKDVAAGHVVRIRQLHQLEDEEVVLVMDLAAGGSLAGLIARRGRLHPSELVTVLGPLATVLSDAHSRGLRHGDLTPSNIVFTADGRPLLSDFGLALITGERPPEDSGFRDPALVPAEIPTPASDVFGLAAVGYAALTGVPPRPADAMASAPAVAELAPWVPAALASVVEAAMSPDPAMRPSAASFATAVLRSGPAAPVRLGGPKKSTPPEPEGTKTVRRTKRIPRSLVLVGFVVATLVVSAIAGVGWARLNPPTAAALQPGPVATTNEPKTPPAPALGKYGSNYKPIVAHLFALRAKAFATGQTSLLREVYAPASAVLDMDNATLRVLRSQHLRARGFTQRIDTVTTEDESAGFADLWVTTAIPAYVIVNQSGRVVARRTGRTQHFEMTIGRYHGTWLVRGLGKKASG